MLRDLRIEFSGSAAKPAGDIVNLIATSVVAITDAAHPPFAVAAFALFSEASQYLGGKDLILVPKYKRATEGERGISVGRRPHCYCTLSLFAACSAASYFIIAAFLWSAVGWT